MDKKSKLICLFEFGSMNEIILTCMPVCEAYQLIQLNRIKTLASWLHFSILLVFSFSYVQEAGDLWGLEGPEGSH